MNALLQYSYTILPFFYFGPLHDGGRALLVTDHPERIDVRFQGLRIPVQVCVPPQLAEKLDPPQREKVTVWSEAELSERFDLIILDLESQDLSEYVHRAGKALKPGGRLIILDWSRSSSEALRNLPRHLKSPAPSGGRYLDALLPVREAGLQPQWYFLLEPDLRKPRYLVQTGFQSTIPALSESPLKRWLTSKGYFYLQPRHKVIVSTAGGNDNGRRTGLLDEIIDRVLETHTAPERRQAVRQIYISTTNVLLVQLGSGLKSYFIRFPFTEISIRRVANQAAIIRFLYENGVQGIPRPITLNPDTYLPVYIEEGIPGKSKEKEFEEAGIGEARHIFSQALHKIRELHQRFGRAVPLDDRLFEDHLGARLAAIAAKLPPREKPLAAALTRLAAYLKKELLGKTVLISVCHGDFKVGNCLFDDAGNFAGIIDWDMGEKEGLSLADLASLLARSLRQRYGYSLATLILKSRNIPDDFTALYRDYFKTTGTDDIPLPATLLFYWVDRVYKQFVFDSHLKDRWIQDNVLPVLREIEGILP